MEHLLRLDIKIKKQEDAELLEEVKDIFQRNQYSDAIRDCIRNYPRLLKELENVKSENNKLKDEIADRKKKVYDFITALNNLKT